MQRFSSLLESPSQRKSSQPQDQDQTLVALPSSTELDIPQYQRSTTLGPPEKTPVRSKPLPLCSGVLTSELQRKSTEVNDLKHTKSTLEKHEIKSNLVMLQDQEIDLTSVVKLAGDARGMKCCLSRRPVFGDHDWIIFLLFQDNVEWIARIPLRSHRRAPQLPLDSPLFKERYECMIATIEYVATNTTLPVPRVHDYDLTSDNILLRPYILMDCLPGKPLSSCIDSLNDTQIKGLVRQWAQYTMDLATLQFPEIGTLRKEDDTFVIKPLLPESLDDPTDNRGPFRSVADYLFAMSDLKKRNVASTNPNPHAYGNFLRSSLIESLIPFYLLPEYLNSPFVLSHRNLDLQSILVDSSGRLSGILSWQNAAILPLQSHIRVPDSLNTEFMPPSEIGNHSARIRFSHRFRPYFEKAMIQAGAQSKWNTEELIDRSLMFVLFERAILRAKDERYLPALWEHVFGNAEGAEEFRAAMKTGDWGVAMADRLGIDVGPGGTPESS
jgi:hypothetical protein